jgi:ABC-type multidrug transport system fused ATPase/permease subunit
MKNSENMLFFMVRQTWRYAEHWRRWLVLFYVLFFVAVLFIAFQPMVLATIINTVQDNNPDAVNKALFWAAIYGALTIGFWILHGPGRVIERRLGYIVFHNFVSDLYRKVTEMPLRWHQDHHSGDTINRVNKSGRSLFNFAQEQFVIIQMTVRFTTALIMLAIYSGWVVLASVGISGLIALLIRRFDKELVPLIEATNEREHHLNAALYDYISNIATVITLRLQKDTQGEIGHRIKAMRPSFWREVVVNEQKWGIVNMLLVCTQAGIVGFYIAFHYWRYDPLAIGSVVAIFQYLLMISGVFYDAATVYSRLMQRYTDFRTVDGLLGDHARLAMAPAGNAAQAWREIRIEGLTFTHHEGEDLMHTLRGIDLAIEAGQKIAFIGTSGAGKTTLLTLMRGLYETLHVSLTIDGVAYKNLAPLSGFTTLVPQDSEIFENTVLYNLTLATDAPDAVVKEALAITTFGDVASSLPSGLETDIRERGVNLSGGQKQRLALARGLIAARNSSLLLLDEPTSSVDLPTEAIIFDRLFAAFADKAIVASIHRLHLLSRFDHICVMQNGVIAEQGSFAGLLATHGILYKLWQQHLAQGAVGEAAER